MTAKMGFDLAMQLIAERMGPEQSQLMEQQSHDVIRQGIIELKTYFDGQKSQYLSNKERRDIAAFRVLDISGDGQLQRDEVVAALMPNTRRNIEFMKALGFDIEAGAQQMFGRFRL